MEPLCPKCGAEATAESCPRCGLVFAKFDPEALDRDVPETLKTRWSDVRARWDDPAVHDRFIEQAISLMRGDYAARCYRPKSQDPIAGERLAELGQRLAIMATGLADVMSSAKSDPPPRRKGTLSLGMLLLVLLLGLLGLGILFLTILK